MQLPKPGDVLLGKYLLEAPLGEGGMGVVYSAYHQLLRQRVAVKLVRPEFVANAEAVTRFLNEARAAASIESDHVARVLDVGMLEERAGDGGLPYMVMELLDGSDLSQVLRARGPLPIIEVVDLLLQTCLAVSQAHAMGIVHRDLKPSNLFLVRRQDGSSRLKVLDFGISKAISRGGEDPSMTRTNALLGSPLYMSPEQLRDSKGVDHRSDIWALGVVAYELLAGKPPFYADNAVALFAAISESDPMPLRAVRPDVPAPLEAAILRCLRRRPDERFAWVSEFAAAIAPFGSSESARGFEHASRRVPRPSPLGESVAPPAPNSAANLAPTAGAPTHSTAPARSAPRSPPSPGSATADPWAASRASTGTTKTSRPLFAIFSSLALFVTVAAGAGLWWRQRQPTPAPAASASLPPSETRLDAAAAIDGATASTDAEASAPATATASAVAAPQRSAASQPASPPNGPQHGPRRATGPSQPASPTAATATVPTSPPPEPSSRGAGKNCNPPYEIDGTGKKVWKMECL